MNVHIPPFPPKFHHLMNLRRQFQRGGRYQAPAFRRFYSNKKENISSPVVPSDSSCVSPDQVQFRHAVPPPSRRFVNNVRKTNGNNGGKYRNMKVVDEGGAGDAPLQDTCAQLQALSL